MTRYRLLGCAIQDTVSRLRQQHQLPKGDARRGRQSIGHHMRTSDIKRHIQDISKVTAVVHSMGCLTVNPHWILGKGSSKNLPVGYSLAISGTAA
jgi:hypothetical protein